MTGQAESEVHGLSRQRYTRTVLVAGLVSTVTYVFLVLGVGGRRVTSNFYDLQARALFDGHFHVPPGSLGIEAFVVRGHDYLYFPPGPSLLRMPVLLFTDRFDGRLTPLSMLLAYVLTTVLLALLMWRVRGILRGNAPLGRAEALGFGVLLVVGTAGSTVLYLGSIPWVFHEAYAWAIPMTLGSGYALLGVIQRPTTAGLVATGLFTAGAVLSRTTAGWACAGAILLTAVFLPRSRPDADRHLWWKLYVVGLLPVALGMAINWAKFRHPYTFPIEAQVYTGLSQHRRDALAANGGDLFAPNMIWSTTVNYFRPDGIRFTPVFPFISLPPRIAASYGGGFIDQSDRVGSIVSFMPLLFGLAVWGVVTTFRRGAARGAELLRFPLLGALAVPAGIMFFAYVTQRYTAEFIPVLLFGASIGFVDVARRLTDAPRRTRRTALAAMGALGLFGVAATTAAALTTQAVANPGPDLESYISRQERVSSWLGDPIRSNISRYDELPLTGRADELAIIGDCQALYFGSGDEFRAWAEVGVRGLDLQVDVVDGAEAGEDGTVGLAEFVGHDRSVLALERSDLGYRLTLDGDESGRSATAWHDLDVGDSFEVVVTTDDPLDYRVVAFGEEELTVPRTGLDTDLRFQPNVLIPGLPDPAEARAEGLAITSRATSRIPVCERLLALHGD